MIKLSEIVLLGAIIAFGASMYFVPKSIEKTARLTARQTREGNVVPRFFQGVDRCLFAGAPGYYSIRVHQDENGISTAQYNRTNYFLKVGTNGVPYFEPIRGLEKEVERK